MDTKIVNLQLLDEKEQDAVYEEAAGVIRKGGLVAFPTETVYGLGANALDEQAAARIYAAKGRPSDNPLIAHISREEQLEEIAAYIPEAARILMKNYWPGPLTMIFRKKDVVPRGTTGGLDTVAVRMPDHPVAKRLIDAAGVPIAAPSANISGKPSPTTAQRTAEDMDGKIEMILDGGPCRIGIESTIVDMTEEVPVILRPGFITFEMLEELLGAVRKDKALDAKEGQNFRPKAPGQKYRHYAPKAPMTLVEGDVENAAAKIRELTEVSVREGKKVGIICTDETISCYEQGIVKSMGSRARLESVAHNLYEILREFDEAGVEVIYSEAFPSDELGFAVMNRLVKAAGHKEIQV
ncbi:MAG: L-threonylcarbamoyladenylate synthase [Lachnospiraceae bacterium]|nr:L-threonylcarbamoyladenylate synthase [Lachnospiraceae bacterium]MDY4969723.1 L-threonylcarbamoyladenylate synthase [Lachnospiraceae bacterium]